MHRQSKSPLKVKENESGCLEEKDEASLPPPKDQKSCKRIKFRVVRASRKENLSDGNPVWPPKRALNSPRGLGQELPRPEGDPGSCRFPGGCWGDVGADATLPGHRQEEFPGSRAGSLGSDSHSTAERGKAEGKADLGLSEGQRGKPVDFAAVTIAEFGIAPESFTERCKGDSPNPLKLRRRSTIGLRGSPENNTLIRYLAQQRSRRQKEAFTQISPFKHADVRSLKDKIETFQTSFESLQEAEGETGLIHGEDSQEGGSSQNKVPLKKEPNLEQWSEKFMVDNSGADLKENCRENVTMNSKSDPWICSILSPNPAGTQPAPPKEWVYGQENPPESLGQKNPPESLETVAVGDTLERGHDNTDSLDFRTPKKKKVTFGEVLSPEIFDQTLPANTPLRRGASPGLSSSPAPRPGLTAQPPPRLDLDCDDECVEPPQRFLEASCAAEDPSPVENAEGGAVAVNPKSWNAGKAGWEQAVVEGLGGKSIIPAADVNPNSWDLDMAPSRDGTFQVSLEAAQEVPNVVPDAEGGFDTPFQQGEEAACENEAEESSSLRENEQLQGNLLEFLEQQATDVHEGAPRTQCPQPASLSGSPARRRRRRSSSAIYFPPVETLETTGTDLPVSSYNVEEVLSVPRAPFQPSRRRSSTAGDPRVRRSTRLSREAGREGLVWIQLPKEPPLPAAAPRSRRRLSTSSQAGFGNVHPAEREPSLLWAPGKENEDSARRAEGSGRRGRRKSAPTPPETS
ncbi:hypothetical protein BTVI_33338 [Pitangus sulphuratus]|nr:hypothetical protein BTVI_33338 [Pitangus sulphuratus]